MNPTRWQQFTYAWRVYRQERVRPAWWHALVFALAVDGNSVDKHSETLFTEGMNSTDRCKTCFRPFESDTEPVCGCHLPPHQFVSGSVNGRVCSLCQRGGTAKIHRAVTA